MKITVPHHPPRSWQLDLGLAANLISPNGQIARASKWQQRAILAVAYQVQIARLHGVTPEDGARLTARRQRRVDPEPRSVSVRLGELEVFAPSESLDLTIHPEFDRFAAAVPDGRMKKLADWAPPFVAVDGRTGRMHVYSNQLTTGLARYLAPDLMVAARLYKSEPTHQLTFLEVASLVLYVFSEFIDRNSNLVCRLARTSAEAGLLIGKSANTTASVRKELGVLKL